MCVISENEIGVCCAENGAMCGINHFFVFCDVKGERIIESMKLGDENTFDLKCVNQNSRDLLVLAYLCRGNLTKIT